MKDHKNPDFKKPPTETERRWYTPPPIPHQLEKLIVKDPEGRIRDPFAGRQWRTDFVDTPGWPSGRY